MQWRDSIWRDGQKHLESAIRYQQDWLINRCDLLASIAHRKLPIDATNSDLKDEAQRLSQSCHDANIAEGGDGGARLIVQDYGYEWPGLPRASCPRWWKRALCRSLDDLTEEAARSLGHVGGRSASYISEQTYMRKLGQRKANERAVNAAICTEQQSGEECALADAVAASVANPKIRRAELMTRLKGLDVIAGESGHVGLFITGTLGSTFHPVHWHGDRNERWSGASVAQGHANMMSKWKRTRARWTKHGLTFYGMRVVEPHECGTPHWHLIVFVRPDEVRKILGHFLRCFREDERNIPRRSALVHRVKVERIRTDKGGAAAYLAKYVSKNIDGEGLETAEKSAARRVRGWASGHRIRQFDFFGGPPVGIWREVRRIPDDDDSLTDMVIAAAHVAANRHDEQNADWAGYVRANGGIACRRRDRPLQLQFEFDVTERGAKYSAYGDFKWMRIIGIECGPVLAITRKKRWSIRWGGGVGSTARSALPWTRSNNCNHDAHDGSQSVDCFSRSVSQLVDIESTTVEAGESFTSGLKRSRPRTLVKIISNPQDFEFQGDYLSPFDST